LPKSLPLPPDVYKRKDGRWCRECPQCGTEIDHLRRNYCVGASLIQQPCKACSNKNNHPSGMVGSVRLAWYNVFMKSAITRGYEWDITPEFVDAMYNEQKGLCAYSGVPIGWSSYGWDHTASIDRIENSIGYKENNIHLVHKEVNMMRGSLSNDRFLELCSLIAKVKW